MVLGIGVKMWIPGSAQKMNQLIRWPLLVREVTRLRKIIYNRVSVYQASNVLCAQSQYSKARALILENVLIRPRDEPCTFGDEPCTFHQDGRRIWDCHRVDMKIHRMSSMSPGPPKPGKCDPTSPKIMNKFCNSEESNFCESCFLQYIS